MRIIPVEDVRRALTERGCTGLYYPGECACRLDDLMPCGEAEAVNEGDDLPNGCKAGHVRDDPRPGHAGEWAVFRDPATPTLEQWERIDQ